MQTQLTDWIRQHILPSVARLALGVFEIIKLFNAPAGIAALCLFHRFKLVHALCTRFFDVTVLGSHLRFILDAVEIGADGLEVEGGVGEKEQERVKLRSEVS